VPGSLALHFDIDLSGGHANNYLVQNVSRALVEDFEVFFGGTKLQQTKGYSIFKIYEDLFLSQEECDNMLLEGIQSEDLCRIRSNAGDKKTSGVDSEKKLNAMYGKKYRIRLDHEILKDNGVFYPQALYNDLVFELTLADAENVVKGSDPMKLKYKLRNIEIEYQIILSKMLAEEAHSVYSSGKEFAYDHVQYEPTVTILKGTNTQVNIKVNPQRRSMKAILLLFVEPYTTGARDSEKYVFPDLTKVKVTINGEPCMIYSKGIKATDFWTEARNFFVKEENKTEHMNLKGFLSGDRLGLLIDLRSMPDQNIHGSGTRLVNSTDGVQLVIDRKASGSGVIKCHFYTISDSQANFIGNQLHSVQY